jgi:hypothetical protein
LGSCDTERVEARSRKLGGSGIARGGAFVDLACHVTVLGSASGG